MMTPKEFTQRSVTAAADLGLFFAGMPDEIMAAAMQGIRANLEANLADDFGVEAAASFERNLSRRRRGIATRSMVAARRLVHMF